VKGDQKMSVASFVTGESRLSYVNVMEPRKNEDGSEQYSITVLVPKTDTETVNAIQAAIQAASEYGAEKTWSGKTPGKIFNPMHDGDGLRDNGEPFGEECKGCFVFTANNKKEKPQVVDENGNDILVASNIYSGCYGRVYVDVFPYNHNGKCGVGFKLGPVQKLRDGEPLAGRTPTAAEVFGAPKPQASAASVFG
jgi:hypothetical protein